MYTCRMMWYQMKPLTADPPHWLGVMVAYPPERGIAGRYNISITPPGVGQRAVYALLLPRTDPTALTCPYICLDDDGHIITETEWRRQEFARRLAALRAAWQQDRAAARERAREWCGGRQLWPEREQEIEIAA